MKLRPVFAILLIILAFGAAACGPKIALVKVSEENLRKAIELTKEGNEAYRNGDYYAALIKYLMAGELNPNSSYISNYIGITYLKLDYYEKAIEAFDRSLALNPKFPFTVNNMGAAYFAKGDLKKAEKYFKKAIKMKKDEASFYLNLGTLYFEKKKPEKAISAWRESLALNPNILDKHNSINLSISGENIALKDRYYFMARVYAAADNVPKTIESLEDALLNGFSNVEEIRSNPEFDHMRSDERFIKFMNDADIWSRTE